MSVVCKKTKHGVNHYKNHVRMMSNEWLQMGAKQAVKLGLRSGSLNLLVG